MPHLSSFCTLLVLASLAGTVRASSAVATPGGGHQIVKDMYQYDSDNGIDLHNPLFDLELPFNKVCEATPGGKFTTSNAGNICTWVNSNKLGRDAANVECENQGAEGLAVIKVDAENEAIRNQAAPEQEDAADQYPEGFWIRPTAGSSKFEWYSSSGTQVTYFKWAPGQPNNWGGNQLCCTFWKTTDGTWQDDDCEEQKKSVCMKRKPVPNEITSSFQAKTLEVLCGQTAMGCWTTHTYAYKSADCAFVEKFCPGVTESHTFLPDVRLTAAYTPVNEADITNEVANLISTEDVAEEVSLDIDQGFEMRCMSIPGATYTNSGGTETCLIPQTAMRQDQVKSIKLLGMTMPDGSTPTITFPTEIAALNVQLVISQTSIQKSIEFRCGQSIALVRSGNLPSEDRQQYRDFVVEKCPAFDPYLNENE